MEYTLREIQAPEEKASLCLDILHALPDWFGIESAIAEYAKHSAELPFFAVFEGEKPVGFAAVEQHTRYAAELAVCGILPAYQRQGLGRRLMEACEAYCISQSIPYLTVKTLDATAQSEAYEKTRTFYRALGFVPIEVFPTLWDEANPCLLMLKPLPRSAEA